VQFIFQADPGKLSTQR